VDTFVSFGVFSFDCPKEKITELMGVEPTKSWNKGDVGEYVKKMPISGWQLYSPLGRGNYRLHDHIESLLPILENKASVIVSFSSIYNIGIACGGYFTSDSRPSFHLSSEIITRLSRLCLSVDFDLYVNE
jgi:hypothetical protein